MDQPLTLYFVQSSTALWLIFRQRALEGQGQPMMTTETLDPSIRVWFARKGFADESDGVGQARREDNDRLPKRTRELPDDDRALTKRHCHEIIEWHEKGWPDKLAEQQRQSEVIALSEQGHCFGQAEGHGLLDVISPNNEDRKFLSDVDKLRRNKKVLGGTIPSDEVIELVKRQVECETLDEDIEGDDRIEVCSTQEPPLAPTAQTNEALGKKAYPVKPGFKKFRLPCPKSWGEEGSVFRGKLCPHTVPPTCAKDNLRQICIWQLKLTFPGELNIGVDGVVYVSIEMCAEYLTHPDRWAQAATEEDVCRCLSFRIIGRDSKGGPFAHIPKSKGVLDVFRANTFVDLLLHRKSDFEIAGTLGRPEKEIHRDAP
ncbi:hypothetical protein DL766_008793 [Monosporascus sp. MC13-8B]|uniref:Uncharacterized protein n=1 Tax=Monosporascus cannonballus TaxID=155416 RepID=A0ABY0HD96_9PEZI|nr:hypothetical protein DL762_002524 [Monosporascus cannonballus]RYO98211.1 hypothetical protein DL763_002378 [Monosporascus cannonballus]RYP17892.1 hypothetical protein DL766_008793 [Monosporascus sp. MC13-8B]